MVTKVRISSLLVSEIAWNDLLNEYANFLFLKYHYSNSTVYNYNCHSLSKKTNKSYSFIKRTVSVAIKNGWCSIEKNNLLFLSKEKILNKKRVYYNSFTVDVKKIKSIKKMLQYVLIEIKHNQAMYVHKLRSKNLHLGKQKMTKADYRKAMSSKAKNYKGEHTSKFIISYMGIGKLFNRSSTTAQRYIKDLESAGAITKSNNKKLIKSNVSKLEFDLFKEYNRCKGAYALIKGNIYQILSNEYKLYRSCKRTNQKTTTLLPKVNNEKSK